MFPLAHLEFAGRLLGPLRIEEMLGAVFPDVVVAVDLGWEVTHRLGARLYSAAATARAEGHPDGEVLVRFARAALTHGADPAGLDFYGDVAYGGVDRGFAYQVARPLADRVAAACRLPAELGLWKAHNFVEMAVDLLVDEVHPGWGPSLVTALNAAAPRSCVSTFFDDALALPAGRMAACFARFPSFVAVADLSPLRLAQMYGVQVRAKHGVDEIDVVLAAALIEEAVDLVRPETDRFFETAGEGVARVLARFPG